MDSWNQFEQHVLKIDSPNLTMGWMKRSIYKVPASIKDLNRKVYIPQLVTFGPYHCNYERVTEMDVHKHRALNHFIKNSGKPFSVYVNAMQEIQHELMASYESLDVNLHSSADKFLQHMLLDGCFMLEILRASAAINSPKNTYGNYSATDPIFSYHGKLYVMPYIRTEMLMLENQLPMFLPLKLLMVAMIYIADTEQPYDVEAVSCRHIAAGRLMREKDVEIYLNRMILRFINPHIYDIPIMGSLHVLDLYRKSLIGLKQFMRQESTKNEYYESPTTYMTHSAEKLHEYAIEFQPSLSRCLTDISFNQGKLKLPTIIVDGNSEIAFLNMIAFERVHVGAGNEVTSYVSLMGTIIRSAKDVNLLIKSKTIVNDLGSIKSVAELFEGISRDVTPDPGSIVVKIFKKAQAYSKIKWNAWLVNLKDNMVNNYFKNPWKFLTFLAATFVILLAIAQTTYTILSYYTPGKK